MNGFLQKAYIWFFPLPIAAMIVLWRNFFVYRDGIMERRDVLELGGYLLAFASALLGWFLILAWGKFLRARAEIVEIDRNNQYFRSRIRDLTGQIDLLTAMREVSRIVSNEVDFEKIMTAALPIIEHLIGASEIAVYSLEGERTVLISALIDGKVHAGREIDGEIAGDFPYVEDTLRHKTPSMSFSGETAEIVLPLLDGADVMGALACRVPIAAEGDLRIPACEHAQGILSEIAGHLSLAVKAPSLYNKATVDGLTGLATKRHFLSEGNRLFEISRRSGRTLAMLLLDIDHFKKVNDTYGHPVGDRVLKAVAEALIAEARDADMAFRFGGEEMGILLPDTGSEQAAVVAERAREAVAKLVFRSDESVEFGVSVSAGIAERASHMKGLDEILSLADQALYCSKENGRNRTTICHPVKGMIDCGGNCVKPVKNAV